MRYALNELKHIKEHIETVLGPQCLGCRIHNGELSLTLKAETLRDTIKFLREDATCDYRMLVDITAVDQPEKEARFEVIYHLLSMRLNQRIRLRIHTDETHTIPSVVEFFPSAKWYEREVWDMFGIVFDGHDDLRRILTDYDFDGHPLRKDFPLTGHVEMRYDESQGRCVYEPVELMQDYRDFDFLSPWQGITEIQLPGDEKATKPPFMEDEVQEEKELEKE